jgi:hypothetical protein
MSPTKKMPSRNVARESLLERPLQRKSLLTILIILIVVVLGVFQVIPDARKESGWSEIVMRNWQAEGFFEMKGQLVYNYGGLLPNEKITIYPGHRPCLLYIPYFLKYLLPFKGANFGIYVIFMTCLSFWGIAKIFEYRPYGVIAACIFCLCPGYIANITKIDTISFPGILGVPIMCLAGSFLTEKTQRIPRLIAVATGMSLFMALNWSTLFSLSILGIFIVALGIRKQSAYLVLTLVGSVGLWTLFLAMKSRSGLNEQGDLWNHYLFGPAGYDNNGMTWSKAALRIFGVNLMAWMPLFGWLIAGVISIRPHKYVFCLVPLVGSAITVFSMRNYNAHHPWGAVSLVALGVLMTMAIVCRQTALSCVPKLACHRALAFSLSAALLLYTFSWIALDTHNNKEFYNLYNLISSKTERSSRIFFVENPYANVACIDWSALSLEFDRKISSKSVQQLDSKIAPNEQVPEYYISTQSPPANAQIIASQSCEYGKVDIFMENILSFYRENISKRSKGDRKAYVGRFYLFTLNRPLQRD